MGSYLLFKQDNSIRVNKGHSIYNLMNLRVLNLVLLVCRNIQLNNCQQVKLSLLYHNISLQDNFDSLMIMKFAHKMD